MKERLITLETNKLAKEKGFSNKVRKPRQVYRNYVDARGNETDEGYSTIEINEKEETPTQSLLETWLFNTHNINIELTFDDGQWFVYVGKFSFPDSSVEFVECVACDSFADALNKKPVALEKALQEALNLI